MWPEIALLVKDNVRKAREEGMNLFISIFHLSCVSVFIVMFLADLTETICSFCKKIFGGV